MADTQSVDRLLKKSVEARTRGELRKAIELAEQAIEICRDDVPYGAHLATGIAHAMDGNHQQAQRYFENAIDVQSTDIAQYFLGSVLACQRKFTEASSFFQKKLKIDISETEWTTTEILQLNDVPEYGNASKPDPFKRTISSAPPQAKRTFDFVYLVVCDSAYLELFAEPLASSLVGKTRHDICLHFHVVNPTLADRSAVELIAEKSEIPIAMTTERVVFPSLSKSARKTYYSCARFLVAPDVMEWYGCPLLIADIDQLVVSDIEDMIDEAFSHDINLIRFEQQQFNLLSLFSASVLLANHSPASRTYLENVRTYLKARMRRPTAMTWHLDQAALAVCYLRSTGIDFAWLDPIVMHSTLDGSTDIPDGVLFWSITYSVAPNKKKLKHKSFRQFGSPNPRIEKNHFGRAGPKISIVIPVYNGANYLRKAIDSALAQTWNNIEVVVVNDGSIDGGATERIAESYGDRIRYVVKENGGVASALNAGIAVMTGDVFCWLSHDDMYKPEKTKEQVRFWKNLGYPSTVLYTDYTLIEADGRKITDVVMDHEMLTEKPVYGLFRAAIHGCTIFVPRYLFDEFGVFDIERPTTQDYALWAEMICYVPFVHMPHLFVFSRSHDEQGSKHIDHAEEANQFWSDALTLLPDEEQVLLEGSRFQFQTLMAEFLDANGLHEAAETAKSLARKGCSEKLVSVVIPVYNRFEMTVSALDSVLNQTHENVEVLLVDDGSTEDIAILEQLLAERDKRVRLIKQSNKGPGSARNTGWSNASGEYVAFLDSDDLFLPNKLELQLEEMESTGAAISHTSYWLHTPEGERLNRVASGAMLNGAGAFPEIINNCAVATPTVMVRQDLWSEGFQFPENIRLGEDVVAWISIAARHQLLGIDQALSVVRSNDNSAAYDAKSQQLGILNILSHLIQNPDITNREDSMDELRRTLVGLTQIGTAE